jgi:two-component system, NarL family, nitrate/nitrite response regulator NarL
MAAIAICIAEARLREAVAKSLRAIAPDTAIPCAGSARELVVLLGKRKLDLLIAEWPMLAGAEGPIGVRDTALLALASKDQAIEALRYGARAVLPPDCATEGIAAAALAALRGFAVVQRPLLDSLLEVPPSDDHKAIGAQSEMPSLTARELEVLAALADGASNKLIARRLGISFHTAKFHVAALLEKLDADSRTEAVAKGARLGLVML